MAKTSIRPDQRARLGLTGLALVFLLVLVAAALTRPDSAAGPQPLTHEGATSASAGNNPGMEPLATLGVAPANHPDVSANP
jgi:Tfp pilus assembly protein FimV